MSEQPNPSSRKKWSIKPDTVIASSAVLISLCALIISISENRLMRQQQRVAVYPHLDLDFNYNSEGFSIFIANKGQGLAFVENMEVWLEDKYFENFQDMANQLMPEGHQITYSLFNTGVINEEILSPDEKVLLFKIPWNDESRFFVEKYVTQLEFNICYTSIMGECWCVTGQSNRPAKGKCGNRQEIQFF